MEVAHQPEVVKANESGDKPQTESELIAVVKPTDEDEEFEEFPVYRAGSQDHSTPPPEAPHLPSDYKLRELCAEDFERGFVDLLEQLTAIRPITRQKFMERFKQLHAQKPPGYHIYVVEKSSTGRVVATATLVREWKFIHSCGARGRIEDVVVDGAERGKHFGRILNEYLVALARHFGVYKLSLECTDSLIPFYEQFGFRRDGNNFMVQRF